MKSLKKYTSKYFTLVTLMVILTYGTSCKKFVEIPPPKTQLVTASVFGSDAGAIGAQSGIYLKMANVGDNFLNLVYYPTFSADELNNYSTDNWYLQLFSNSLTSDNSYIQNIWTVAYNYIYEANLVIEGLTNSTTVSSSIKKQLLGEAKFIRAYWNFYLVNLYGDVPVITTTSYPANSTVSRVASVQVLKQITDDLQDAQANLSESFLSADCSTITTERLRPTKWAATTLLARVYLFANNWKDAETQATIVINNTAMFSLLPNLNDVFLKNSKEAIWQIQGGSNIYNTFDGAKFILIQPPPQGNIVSLSTTQLKAFEPGDNRLTKWVSNYIKGTDTFYYAYKYKTYYSTTVTEYEMILRLAELYLIRAEARAQQDNIIGAANDLNVIRGRANLPNTIATTKSDMLSAVLHERQVELFTEGHRWFDLKRTQSIDSVMSVAASKKGGKWDTKQQLYPIPASEISANNKLTQNSGY